MLLHVAVEDFTHEDEAAGEIVAHHRLETLGGDVLERRLVLSARIVHQTVDATESLDNLGHDLLHPLLVADVASERLHSAAVLADLSGDSVQPLLRATDDRHIGPEMGEFVGGTAPDPTAATGHDDRLSLEKS
ncbi:hypothetical protein GORBP_049_00750 [Gordonia rubripertincta NBRC 101908]|uniref:Uncharacterized protein n=1 Tax=Gordonia rubripertincta NBRC 101908 TaxID=1077975 RepID=A0ABQ0HRK6_GORRU|nr:hypothetical protein GORBP_049_00750 [Gordonia rubripertincta NBRC 101908]